MLNLTKMRSLLDARQPKHALPQDFYTDPDVFAFDLAAIYARSWILAGFEVELPEPGSYLSLPIGRSSVLIVRDRQGACAASSEIPAAIAALQPCEAGRGQRYWIICPRTNGRMISTDGSMRPRMPETFEAARSTGCDQSMWRRSQAPSMCASRMTTPAFDVFRALRWRPLLAAA